MTQRYVFAALIGLLTIQMVQGQKNLVIIGSSTSACINVNAVTECYVGRLRSYYNSEVPEDTTIDNDLALGGSNCYNGMPSSYVSPYEASYQPDPTRNITFALTKAPDAILVNYPTNGYDVLPVDSILYCLRTIRDSANAKGVPCFVTTTQPRTSPASFNTSAVKAKLALLKDSILAEFGSFAIDFWTDLINPADTSILYDSGDHIHMNGTGHNILFQRVLASNVFLATLPATLLNFTAQYKNNDGIITWVTSKEAGVDYYEIDRSVDGTSFQKIATVPAKNTDNGHYQYIDVNPLQGNNYYKIVIIDKDGKKKASPVMNLFTNPGRLSIMKAFAASHTQVAIELQNNTPQTADLQLLNSMGSVITHTTRKVEAGHTTLYIETPLLATGVYHIKLAAPGVSAVHSFVVHQ